MACHTQEEIAEREGIDKATVSRFVEESCNLANLPESNKLIANYQVDYEPEFYNVWKFKEKTNGVKHFGNSEITILDNLLAKYTAGCPASTKTQKLSAKSEHRI